MTQKLQYPVYDTFAATRSNPHSNGLAMMPTAGVFPCAASVVALHGGMDYDIIAYTASRRGEPPVVPGPKSTNRNRVFLGGGRSGEFPVPDIAGVTNYFVSGWLVFGILSPEGLASDFLLGCLPFPGVDTNEVIQAGQYLSYSLINQGNGSQALVPVPTLPPLLTGIISRG